MPRNPYFAKKGVSAQVAGKLVRQAKLAASVAVVNSLNAKASQEKGSPAGGPAIGFVGPSGGGDPQSQLN